MTPTQAQIYAAAGAINDALDYEWGPDEWVCSIAKAALTAAAEVGPKNSDVAKFVEAATIERCARIAETAASNFPDTMRREIAAAIRALATEQK